MATFDYLGLENPFEAGFMGEKITGIGLSLLDPSDDLLEGTIFRFISGVSFASDDVINALEWRDGDGKVLARLGGLSITNAELEAGLGIGTPQEGNTDVSYPFLVSLLDGPVKVIGNKADNDDMEVGAGGKATVKGKAGDDRLYVWHQKDVVFDGGKGTDTIEFGHNIGFSPASPNGAVVDLRKGTGTNPDGGTLALKGVENVVGRFEGGNDIRGDKGDNAIFGGLAADRLRGDAGDDTITVKYHTSLDARATLADGGKGKDTLTAELSYGDAAPFTGAGASLIITNTLDLVDPGRNTGTFHGGTFKNFESFNAVGEYFQRFDFRCSAKAESVSGGAGPDILDGGGGNDVLAGRGGLDELTGGEGKDAFRLDAYPNAGNQVAVTDFSAKDSIWLSASAFFGLKGKGKGDVRKLAGDQFFAGAEAQDGGDRILYDKASGRLYFDGDGNGGGAAVLIATLDGNPALKAGDLFVV